MGDIIKKVLEWIAGIIKKFIWEFIILGIINLIAGLFMGHKASNKNNEAKVIRDEALSRFEESDRLTQESLNRLGTLQIEVVETFTRFVTAFERIHGRPQGLAQKLTKASLPKLEPEKLKDLSEKVKLGVAGVGGIGAGAGIGYAALGLQAFIAGPAVFVAGMAVCVKGCTLSKQAVKNRNEAIKLSKEVDKILQYHDELRKAAAELFDAINELKPLYDRHLTELETLTCQKTSWKSYTKQEKVIVENTIRLVALMNKLCQVQLVLKPTKENELEHVNEKAVKTAVQESSELVSAFA